MKEDSLKTYLASYRHDGARWVLEIKARDAEDAKARLSRLAFAQIDGELVAKVPATLGPLAKVAVAVRNGFVRLRGAQI